MPAYFNDQQRKATPPRRRDRRPARRAADQRADRRRARLRHPQSRPGSALLRVRPGRRHLRRVDRRDLRGHHRGPRLDRRQPAGRRGFQRNTDRPDARHASPRNGRAFERDDALYQKLREAAERARRDMSSAPSATMRLVWQDTPYELEIETAEFETQAAALIERLREPVLRALRDSNLRPEALSDIILIGGATRMPVVRRAVARMFGRFPNATVNPGRGGRARRGGPGRAEGARFGAEGSRRHRRLPLFARRRGQPPASRRRLRARPVRADPGTQHRHPGQPDPQFLDPAGQPDRGGVRHLSGRRPAGPRQRQDRRDQGEGAARPGRRAHRRALLL